jgi:CheY-like chemotaxis protein
MGGEIHVESELNKGTVFSMKFPAESLPSVNGIIKTTEEFKTMKPLRRNKLLLVEDDEFSVSVTKQMLIEMCDIDVADTGEQAVVSVKNNKYDAILMDIGLPGIGGLEATGIIRKMKGYENIPIVALTAFAMNGDREEFMRQGCSHYLSKPFTIKELHSTVKEILNIS